MAKVFIIIGSKSDSEYAQKCQEQLEVFGIESVVEISSAHRHPERTKELTGTAEGQGFEVIIAMAGLSAALPGVAAAHSNLPVIGVPLPAALNGLDSLLSVVQMPPGIPVGTMAIGKPGAKNSALFALKIMALKDKRIKDRIKKFRMKMKREVEKKDNLIQKK